MNDLPLFSQIPTQILAKVNPGYELRGKKKKRPVRFYESPIKEAVDEVDVTNIDLTGEDDQTEVNEQDYQENLENIEEFEPETVPTVFIRPIGKIYPTNDSIQQEESNTKCDAKVQTEIILISRHTQTENESSSSTSSYDDYRAKLEADALACPRPIPIPKHKRGREPPLKVGMTMPRGVKRKVFYPDDSDED